MNVSDLSELLMISLDYSFSCVEQGIGCLGACGAYMRYYCSARGF